MEKAAIIITFPQPEDVPGWGDMITRAKTLFEDDSNIKVYAAINNMAERIINLIEGED